MKTSPSLLAFLGQLGGYRSAHPSGEILVPEEQACKLFIPAILKTSFAKWTNDSRIPVQKIGGWLYYKYSDLIAATKTIIRYKS